MSDSVRPHGLQPTRLLRPWDSPGKNTGVGCHFLLQCIKGESKSEVAQSCLTLSDPMDCSPPGSSIHGIFRATVLQWGAIAFSLHSSTSIQIITLGLILNISNILQYHQCPTFSPDSSNYIFCSFTLSMLDSPDSGLFSFVSSL